MPARFCFFFCSSDQTFCRRGTAPLHCAGRRPLLAAALSSSGSWQPWRLSFSQALFARFSFSKREYFLKLCPHGPQAYYCGLLAGYVPTRTATPNKRRKDFFWAIRNWEVGGVGGRCRAFSSASLYRSKGHRLRPSQSVVDGLLL